MSFFDSVVAPKFFAVLLKNTEYSSWSNLNQKESELVFPWPDLNIRATQSQADIYISVTQAFPDLDLKSIKSISESIITITKVKANHGIIAFNESGMIERIGIVSNEFAMNQSLLVKWEDVEFEPKTLFGLIDINQEIQPISKRILDKLELPVALQSEVLKISQLNHKDKVEIFDIEEFKQEEGGKIKLFYGTNRNNTNATDINERYGSNLSDLKYGTCTVSIPQGHTQGEIERPFSFWVWKLKENEEQHIVLKDMEELPESAFFEKLKTEFSGQDDKSALIFIHGYNNSFAKAAMRTAQIAWDVPFNGIAGFYSWPAESKVLAYFDDIERADASIPQFTSFIEGIIQRTGVQKLHLIAHSMGNRIMATTLKDLSNIASMSQQLKIIQQVVLAAADIDQDVFRNSILPSLKNIPAHKTIYSSDKDSALNISAIVRSGRPRVGHSGTNLFLTNSIDTVDASNAPSSGINHSYVFDTKELLTDLHYLLNKGLAPADRRLRRKVKNGLEFWLFPQ